MSLTITCDVRNVSDRALRVLEGDTNGERDPFFVELNMRVFGERACRNHSLPTAGTFDIEISASMDMGAVTTFLRSRIEKIESIASKRVASAADQEDLTEIDQFYTRIFDQIISLCRNSGAN
jgi:hypothetical protein